MISDTVTTFVDDPAREAAFIARIDPWLAHMTWRPNFAQWREGRIWQERYQRERIATIAQYAGALEGRRILDLGAGMGGLCVALALAGAKPSALEYNRAYCEIIHLRAARYNLHLPVINGAGETLPFATATFDLALCWDVVEHVHNPQALLAELARVLRPGGQVLLTIINRYAFRDPHYHLPLINWIPRPAAEWVITRTGRTKQAAFRDMQRLSDMHYFTFGAFQRLAARSGFSTRDIRADQARSGGGTARGLKGRTRDLLQRIGLAQPAYLAYRSLFQGTHELLLTRKS